LRSFSLFVALDRVDWDRVIPHNLSIAASQAKAFFYIRGIGIKALSSFVARLRGSVGNATGEPVAYRSFCHPKTARDLLLRYALGTQFGELLQTIIPFYLMSKVSVSCKRIWSQ
jgi:hypothetical protein